MSIDAVAVLRIADLPAPPTTFGTSHVVEHRGDATLVSLFSCFEAADPDEHALALRRLIGDALDAHDDPRGILLFGDIRYPGATTYEAIVREMADHGVWAPNVAADYVPARYRGAPRQPHDALVGELILAFGRDAALELDLMAQVKKMVVATAPKRSEAAQAYAAQIEAVVARMGEKFAARYEASLQAQVEAAQAPRPATRLDWWNDPTCEIPVAYLDASPGTHDALVGEMLTVMGREAIQVDMAASIGRIMLHDANCAATTQAAYRAELAKVAHAMGGEFAQRYEESLARKSAALRGEVPE